MRCVCALLVLLGVQASAIAAEGSPPSLAIRVEGLVQHPQTLTVAQLRAMRPTRVAATFTTMHGQDSHEWTGVLLWDLLSALGLRDEPGKRTTMRHTLLVRGTDGYGAAIAIGEIDPAMEGKPIVVAYTEQSSALTSLRLVVPGDKHGARSVHDVSDIEVR